MNKAIMRQAGFGAEVDQYEAHICPLCHRKLDFTDFRDGLSMKEWHISGLCQKCQDEVFGK
jgi:hypothetical protein